MDVLTAAWSAAGRPRTDPPHAGAPPTGRRDGSCARCGRRDGGLVPVGNLVSKMFTAFEGWTQPSSQGLCKVCVWGYRTPALRAGAHLVTSGSTLPTATTPTLAALSGAQLQTVLLQGALAAQVALVVPLRPGRKHVLPGAVWGRISVDDAYLPWSDQDAHRLTAVSRLRTQGFGPRTLTAPAPPWPSLARLPKTWWAQILLDWSVLAPWRERRLWLDLAITATSTATRTPASSSAAA